MASGTEIGHGYISISPNAQGFERRLNSETSGPLQAVGKAGGLKMGAAIAAGVAATVAAVGIAGKIAFDIGSQFDNAADTIRVGTGATGAALEALKEDFNAVVADVPADFASAGMAIADLNTRLGLTGKPLQDMAGQLLELSRITGTDLTSNLEASTRVFGDWGVASEDMGGGLDKLFRASQATGISFDALSRQMVQYGAPLRELGFSFEESAAMLGKFEKEGVNAELVLGGLKQGLGRLAKAGKDPRAELDALQKSINEAGLTAENKQKVFEMFGARAGIDMAKALEEGRFEFGELVSAISDGSDTIMAAGADTMDFAESWQLLKNNLMLLVEGPASKVFKWVSDIAASLTPLVQGLGSADSAIAGFGEKFEPLISAFENLMAVVGPWAKEFYEDTIKPALEGAREEFTKLADEVIPTVEVIIDFIRENWPAIRDAIEPVMKGIVQMVGGILRVLAGIIRTVMAVIRGDWSGAWDGIKGIVAGVWQFIKGLFSSSQFRPIFAAAVNVLKWVGDKFLAFKDRVIGYIRDLVAKITKPINDAKELLNKINPFNRESPSLVDNVLAGTKVIRNAYEDLSGMNLRGASIGGVSAGYAASASAAGGGLIINVDARGATDPAGITSAAERGVEAALSRHVGSARLKASMMGA